MMAKFQTVPDIGLRVHQTVRTSFGAFGKVWNFDCQNQAAANIARSCLMYYKPLWDGELIPSLDRKDVIVDVGAHMGFFSIPISSQVNKVIAYEPSPANHKLLLRNTMLNDTRNILVSNQAVGDRGDGNTILYLGVTGTTGHSITSHKRGGVQLEVPVTSIKEIVRLYSPSVLKLDCEGAEWLILTSSNIPYLITLRCIIAELHKVQQHNLKALKQMLKHSGFKVEVKSNSWFTKLIAFK